MIIFNVTRKVDNTALSENEGITMIFISLVCLANGFLSHGHVQALSEKGQAIHCPKERRLEGLFCVPGGPQVCPQKYDCIPEGITGICCQKDNTEHEGISNTDTWIPAMEIVDPPTQKSPVPQASYEIGVEFETLAEQSQETRRSSSNTIKSRVYSSAVNHLRNLKTKHTQESALAFESGLESGVASSISTRVGRNIGMTSKNKKLAATGLETEGKQKVIHARDRISGSLIQQGIANTDQTSTDTGPLIKQILELVFGGVERTSVAVETEINPYNQQGPTSQGFDITYENKLRSTTLTDRKNQTEPEGKTSMLLFGGSERTSVAVETEIKPNNQQGPTSQGFDITYENELHSTALNDRQNQTEPGRKTSLPSNGQGFDVSYEHKFTSTDTSRNENPLLNKSSTLVDWLSPYKSSRYHMSIELSLQPAEIRGGGNEEIIAVGYVTLPCNHPLKRQNGSYVTCDRHASCDFQCYSCEMLVGLPKGVCCPVSLSNCERELKPSTTGNSGKTVFSIQQHPLEQLAGNRDHFKSGTGNAQPLQDFLVMNSKQAYTNTEGYSPHGGPIYRLYPNDAFPPSNSTQTNVHISRLDKLTDSATLRVSRDNLGLSTSRNGFVSSPQNFQGQTPSTSSVLDPINWNLLISPSNNIRLPRNITGDPKNSVQSRHTTEPALRESNVKSGRTESTDAASQMLDRITKENINMRGDRRTSANEAQWIHAPPFSNRPTSAESLPVLSAPYRISSANAIGRSAEENFIRSAAFQSANMERVSNMLPYVNFKRTLSQSGMRVPNFPENRRIISKPESNMLPFTTHDQRWRVPSASYVRNSLRLQSDLKRNPIQPFSHYTPRTLMSQSKTSSVIVPQIWTPQMRTLRPSRLRTSPLNMLSRRDTQEQPLRGPVQNYRGRRPQLPRRPMDSRTIQRPQYIGYRDMFI